jgi:putative heme iron utilization protein
MPDISNAASPSPGAMPGRLPENAPAPDFDAKALAKTLLRATRAGTLATIDRNTGHPFASLVNVATDSDGAPLILVSRLSTHTANLEADGRAALLLATTGKGDPLAHPRLTVIGRFTRVPHEDPTEARIRRRFLARHPKSELYAGFGDFSFWRLYALSAHLHGGFARAADLKAADLLTPISGAEDLVAAEASAVTHMNADHAGAVALYATKLLGADDGAWRLTGVDPDGLDLARGDLTLRLPFASKSPMPSNCAASWWIWQNKHARANHSLRQRLMLSGKRSLFVLHCSAERLRRWPVRLAVSSNPVRSRSALIRSWQTPGGSI